MVSKTARLVLQLIDNVSGPAKGIVSALGGVNKAIHGLSSAAMAPTRAVTHMARNMRRQTGELTAMSTGVAIGIAKIGKDVYELERQLNISVAAGELTMKQRAELMNEAVALNADYAATSAEIVAGANELLKSGLTYDQTMGALRGVLDTAQAMDVGIASASEAVVTALVSQRMEMDTIENTMKSSIKMADLYAHAVAETTGALDDFALSGRYFNPIAAAIGMSPEEAMAFQISLAKAGIMGSSAGTGLRNAPVRIAAPTKKGRAALASLGVDNNEFVGKGRQPANGASLAAVLEAQGFSPEAIESQIDALIANPAFANAPAKLANAIISAMGDDVVTGEDRMALSDTLQRAITNGISEVDMAGFLRALHDAGAGLAEYDAIFGRFHASKMMAIDPDLFDKVYAEVLANSSGRAKQMRNDMMQGIVLIMNELTAAWEKMAVAIGNSGMLKDAGEFFTKVGDFLTSIADTNPEMLRFGSYAAIALAALAPLGFAVTGATAALALLVNPLALVAATLGYLAYQNWDSLVAFGQNFKLSFLEGIDPAAIQTFKELATSIGGWMESIGSALGNKTGGGSGIGGWLAEEINRTARDIEKLKAELTALAEWIKGVMAIDLYAVGAGILQSLLNGLKAAGQAVIDYIVGLASKIKSALTFDIALPGGSPVGGGRGAIAGSTGGGIVGNGNPVIGGKRASGGPVRRGLTYEVNERGTETISMGTNGYVTPAHKVGGAGVTQNISFHITGGDPRAIAREIGTELDRQLDRSRQISLDGRPVV